MLHGANWPQGSTSLDCECLRHVPFVTGLNALKVRVHVRNELHYSRFLVRDSEWL